MFTRNGFGWGITRGTIRRGTSAVELAVVLPIIVILLLGTVEIGRAVTVQTMLCEAARAGCRVYCIGENSKEDAQDIIDMALENAGIEGYTVSFDPATSEEIDEYMEPVSISISVDYEKVAWLSPWFMSGKSVTGAAVMPADTGKYSSVPDTPDDDDDKGKNKKNKKPKNKAQRRLRRIKRTRRTGMTTMMERKTKRVRATAMTAPTRGPLAPR